MRDPAWAPNGMRDSTALLLLVPHEGSRTLVGHRGDGANAPGLLLEGNRNDKPVETKSEKEKKPEPWQRLLPFYIHDQVSLLSVLEKHLKMHVLCLSLLLLSDPLTVQRCQKDACFETPNVTAPNKTHWCLPGLPTDAPIFLQLGFVLVFVVRQTQSS